MCFFKFIFYVGTNSLYSDCAGLPLMKGRASVMNVYVLVVKSPDCNVNVSPDTWRWFSDFTHLFFLPTR